MKLQVADRNGIGNMKGKMLDSYQNDPDMILLWGAEMDFATAPVITNRLEDIALRGLYGYTLQDKDYNQAVRTWMKQIRSLDVDDSDIIVTHGTIFALNTAIRAFTEKGDSVLIQSPSYYRFDRAIINNERNVIYNSLKQAEHHYELDFDDLERKMALPKTKLMVLCNPHNPTGSVFQEDALRKVAELSKKYEVIIFSDEILAEYTYDQGLNSLMSYGSITWNNAIISTSMGKSFNFTGVNHANVFIHDAAVKEKFERQRKIDHFGSIDPFFYNGLIAGYSQEGYEWITAVKDQVYKNYSMIKEYLETDIPEIKISDLEGGFSVWMDFRRLGMNGEELDHFLTSQAHILGDPGWEYGADGDGFYRFPIATMEETIRKFLEQLDAAVRELREK